MRKEQSKNEFDAARKRMLENNLKGRGIKDSGVLKVMSETPREAFVPADYRFKSYEDGPLPIGFEQTISQPYIVALMTQELHIDKNCIVLEIGTGSGYQTAILSKLAKKVYTIERLKELSQSAQAVLDKSGCDNIEFHIGDGSAGWPESKLFDRIIVTAAVPSIPKTLINQLANNGLIVIPVGYSNAQELIICEKRDDKIIERKICDVRFVKLFGKYGFSTWM